MNIQPPSAQKSKIGTCPHGLPQGACPICSGIGGSKKPEKKPESEMSWDECYAVWQQILKAKELTQQKRNEVIQNQMQAQVNFTSKLENASQKITTLTEKLTTLVQKTSSTPAIMSKPVIFAAKLAIPILNVLKNIPILAQKTVNFAKEKLADISDKLNAIFGELKNSTEKKISDKLKNSKKKFKSIFGIFENEDVADEEKKIEENKRHFEMKTILNSIKEKISYKKSASKTDANESD